MKHVSTHIPKLTISHAANMLGITTQAVHKYCKSKGVPLPRLGNKSYISHVESKVLFSLTFKRKKIAFHIVKGGTGKTTTIHNIACCASAYGAKVLLIDLDPQANLTDTFSINAEESPVLIDVITGEATMEDSIINVEPGIDIIPSRIENVVLDSKLAVDKKPIHKLFSNLLKGIEDEYDYIFIDCPPTMGHSVTAASIYAGLVVTPLNPDKYSSKGLKILKDELAIIQSDFGISIDYRVYLNKFSGNTILSDKTISTTISEENAKGKALSTAVRLSQEIPNTVDMELNLFSSLKKSIPRDDFDLLTRELLEIDVLEQKNQRNSKSSSTKEESHA